MGQETAAVGVTLSRVDREFLGELLRMPGSRRHHGGSWPLDVPPLTCEECGREQADDERGWRSYLTTDEDEPAVAIVYCPRCAEREFGPGEDRRRSRASYSAPNGKPPCWVPAGVAVPVVRGRRSCRRLPTSGLQFELRRSETGGAGRTHNELLLGEDGLVMLGQASEEFF